MSALAPRLRPARVTVRLKDGRSATQARDSHRGDFNEPFAEAELRDKFRLLAGTVLAEDAVAAVEAAIEDCEAWTSTAELAKLVGRRGRA